LSASICGDATVPRGGMARMPAMQACRQFHRRQGPPGLTAADGDVRTTTCRKWHWRQELPGAGQAARAPCRLARGAATQRWSILAYNFRGGLFCHFIGVGGLMCQKFHGRSNDRPPSRCKRRRHSTQAVVLRPCQARVSHCRLQPVSTLNLTIW
jgi:hypothetical protein